jgi:hypothetical protein
LLELNCRLDERFNVSCFAAPPIEDSEVKRVSMAAFVMTASTTSIWRCSRELIAERAGIEFRFEFFNLLNDTVRLEIPVLICAIHRLRADARSLRQRKITMPREERQTNSSSVFVWRKNRRAQQGD